MLRMARYMLGQVRAPLLCLVSVSVLCPLQSKKCQGGSVYTTMFNNEAGWFNCGMKAQSDVLGVLTRYHRMLWKVSLRSSLLHKQRPDGCAGGGFFERGFSCIFFFQSRVLAVSIQSGVVLCLSVGYSIHTPHFLVSGRKRINGILEF